MKREVPGNKWAHEFNKMTAEGVLNPVMFQKMMESKELALYFTKESVPLTKNEQNEKFLPYMIFLVTTMEQMFEIFKRREYIRDSSFNTIAGYIVDFYICEKRFMIETWATPNEVPLFLECLSMTGIRLSKYLIYLHEQITFYLKRRGVQLPETGDLLIFDRLQEELPIEYESLSALVHNISDNSKECIKGTKSKYTKSLIFKAISKCSSICSLFLSIDTQSLKSHVMDDKNSYILGQFCDNLMEYYSNPVLGNRLLLGKRGEMPDLSRENSESGSRSRESSASSQTEDRRRSRARTAMLLRNDEDDEADDPAFRVGDPDMNARDTQEFAADEGLPNTISSVIQQLTQTGKLEMLSAPSNNIRSKLGAAADASMSDYNKAGAIMREAFDTITNREWSLDPESQRLLRAAGFIDADGLLDQEKLFQIHGNSLEKLISMRKKRPQFEKELPQIPINEERNLTPQDIQNWLRFIDLEKNTYVEFKEGLDNYMSTREIELKRMKKLLEEEEEARKKKDESTLREQEKRRGGWKTNRAKKAANESKTSEPFVLPKVDLTKKLNVVPEMFSFFDKDKVVRRIEMGSSGQETYEYVIPEDEQAFDPEKEPMVLNTQTKFEQTTFFGNIPRQNILEKKAYRNNYDYRLNQYISFSDMTRTEADFVKKNLDRKKDKLARFRSYNLLSMIKVCKDKIQFNKVKSNALRQNWTVTTDVLVRGWRSQRLLLLVEKDRKGLKKVYCVF